MSMVDQSEMGMGATYAYSFICTIDGRQAEFHVWADNKAEAVNFLRNRGIPMAVKASRLLKLDNAAYRGDVLWVR